MVAWSEVTKAKSSGRLGIVSSHIKNKALLCKWTWRFERDKEALWRKVLVARYGANNAKEWDLDEKVDMAGSLIVRAWWRIGMGRGEVRCIFKDSLRILVRKGDRPSFWTDL